MFALSNEEIFNLQHTIAYLLLFINCIALASVQCIAMLAISVTMESAVKSNFAHPCVGTSICIVYIICPFCDMFYGNPQPCMQVLVLCIPFTPRPFPCSWTSVYTLFPFHTAEFLDHFRQQFIADVDASAIALELEQQDIISNGDQKTIRQEVNATLQAQLLHACLKKTCDAAALMDVCDVIAMVKGNRRMKSFGSHLKTEWEKGVCSQSGSMCMYLG